MSVRVEHGDARDVLATFAPDSIDACVTDPPYSLVSIVKRFGKPGSAPCREGADGRYRRVSAGFMGKQWDTGETAFDPAFWSEVLRVLKPGAHVLAFGGTRTYHRLACAIEDAGFEIRDQIGWLYGSGFPKSHDVSKAIDKAAGAEREVVATEKVRDIRNGHGRAYGEGIHASGRDGPTYMQRGITAPATEAARQWAGWGTALKPSQEPLVVAQKSPADSQLHAQIVSTLLKLWSRLWLMLPASVAAEHSALSPSAYGVDVSAFAQWSADAASSTRDALCAQMGTSPFVSATISSLNTVSSWSATLGASSPPPSTFTTETASSTTIDWRTLKSSLLAITPESIILAHRSGAWSIADASPAERYFSAVAQRLNVTLELSVLDVALREGRISFPEETVQIEPGLSPICVARKPLIGTVAENVLAHGTGAINIDGCRIFSADDEARERENEASQDRRYTDRGATNLAAKPGRRYRVKRFKLGATMIATGGKWRPEDGGAWYEGVRKPGRWPANVIHDGSDEVLEAFAQYGTAARFFYTAKADKDDRLQSKHPTVKPVDLMAYLCRLITPPGGTVLDPFAGSGTTAMACLREGFGCILIEREAEYVADIHHRLAHVAGADTPLFA